MLVTRGWLPATPGLRLAVLALLVFGAYGHVLWQPLLEDDYVQIDLGRGYGPVERWPALAADVLYRSRATSIWLTHGTEAWFGIAPAAFYATMLLIHIGNAWLMQSMVAAAGGGVELAFVSAAYFAVQAGHQEAVMWYAALPELLVFTLTVGFLLAWNAFGQGRGRGYGALAVGLFLFALASKESAVVGVPLAAVILWRARASHAKWLVWGALVLISSVYTWRIFAASAAHLHLNDGTFSIHAPFWITFRNSVGRLMWVWGAVSLVAIVLLRQWTRWRGVFTAAGLWIAVTLMPYVFLTYMPRIPSRHTYFASVGLAVVVGAGLLAMDEWFRARGWVRVGALLICAVLASEASYIWIAKRPQILARAEPTEALVRFARQHEGPIYLRCFPFFHTVAGSALRIMLHRPESELLLVPGGPGVPEFCYGSGSNGGPR